MPRAEIDGDIGDSHVGLQARMMSQAMRKLGASINKTKTIAIFINQLREKVGVMFGNPETTPGGRALKFYASVRLDVRGSTQIKGTGDQKDTNVGKETKIKVVKNKVAPPFKEALSLIHIYFIFLAEYNHVYEGRTENDKINSHLIVTGFDPD